MRVLRIAHASLTPALRQRERALARSYPAVDLEVLTTDTWREAELEVNAAADDLFPLRTARTYFSRHIQLFAYDPLPIIRALREHRPHLVDLNHEPYSIACAEILTLCQWFSPQSLIVMQTAQNILRRYPPPFKSLEKRAFRQVSAAYVCSETVREVLRAKGFIKPAVIIPFGVNTEAFRPSVTTRQRSEKGLTIGFVGRMLEAKGLKVLAYALAKLATDRWQLLAVGDGPDREEFARELAEAGLLDRVKFTGAVDYDLVPGYFHQMDMLVMPTQTTDRIREQFGRVLIEAMASGVPVIGSTSGAIPEVIGEAGLVVPERDPGALASAIRRMLSENSLRERLAIAGRARVERHYSWERVAENTYDLFKQILTASKQSVLVQDSNWLPKAQEL